MKSLLIALSASLSAAALPAQVTCSITDSGRGPAYTAITIHLDEDAATTNGMNVSFVRVEGRKDINVHLTSSSDGTICNGANTAAFTVKGRMSNLSLSVTTGANTVRVSVTKGRAKAFVAGRTFDLSKEPQKRDVLCFKRATVEERRAGDPGC
jgi:hypothetical protein